MPHRSPITCVDQHVETGLRATGGYDGCVVCSLNGVEIWSTQFDDLVNDVRIDSSASRVAVAVADRYAVVLDLATGERTSVFGPHGDDVNAVRWSPDGQRLACVMDHLDTTVRIWDCSASAAAPSVVLDGHSSGVFAVAFDPSGTRLATVAEDSTARIWDLSTGATLHVLTHPGDPEALDWSPDGRFVATGCDDGIARVWDPADGRLVRELDDASAAVRFIRFDASSTRMLAGAYDAIMRVYDVATWTVADSYTRSFQWERAAAFTQTGIVVGSFGAEAVEQPLQLRELALTYGINALSARGNVVLVGRDDGAVVDVLRGRVITRHDTIVNTVALAPDGATVASGDYRGGVRVTPFGVGSLFGVGSSSDAVSTRAQDGGPINSIVWDPTGERFYSGGYDGCIREWTAAGVCTSTLEAHHGPIKSLAWSASAGLLVAGSSDGSLSAWRGSSLAWRATTDDLVLVNAVACADDAGVVVSVSRDLRVRLWDAVSGALVETLGRGHTKSVKAVAIASDASLIVTGSYDGTAIVWRRNATGWAWTPLRLHGKPGVPAVGLADGNVFTAGWDATVGRWSEAGVLTAHYRVDRTR